MAGRSEMLAGMVVFTTGVGAGALALALAFASSFNRSAAWRSPLFQSSTAISLPDKDHALPNRLSLRLDPAYLIKFGYLKIEPLGQTHFGSFRSDYETAIARISSQISDPLILDTQLPFQVGSNCVKLKLDAVSIFGFFLPALFVEVIDQTELNLFKSSSSHRGIDVSAGAGPVTSEHASKVDDIYRCFSAQHFRAAEVHHSRTDRFFCSETVEHPSVNSESIYPWASGLRFRDVIGDVNT